MNTSQHDTVQLISPIHVCLIKQVYQLSYLDKRAPSRSIEHNWTKIFIIMIRYMLEVTNDLINVAICVTCSILSKHRVDHILGSSIEKRFILTFWYCDIRKKIILSIYGLYMIWYVAIHFIKLLLYVYRHRFMWYNKYWIGI